MDFRNFSSVCHSADKPSISSRGKCEDVFVLSQNEKGTQHIVHENSGFLNLETWAPGSCECVLLET